MTKIDMSFDKDEFQLLVKLLYTGFYVCEKDNDPNEKRYEMLVDRFLQSARAYRIFDGIEYKPELDRYFFDADQEESILEDYNHFVEDTFWDELIFRLSRRDFVNEVGISKIQQMEDIKRISEEEKYKDRYIKEMEANGLERIGIVK
jgi:hypothetical protein